MEDTIKGLLPEQAGALYLSLANRHKQLGKELEIAQANFNESFVNLENVGKELAAMIGKFALVMPEEVIQVVNGYSPYVTVVRRI